MTDCYWTDSFTDFWNCRMGWNETHHIPFLDDDSEGIAQGGNGSGDANAHDELIPWKNINEWILWAACVVFFLAFVCWLVVYAKRILERVRTLDNLRNDVDLAREIVIMRLVREAAAHHHSHGASEDESGLVRAMGIRKRKALYEAAFARNGNQTVLGDVEPDEEDRSSTTSDNHKENSHRNENKIHKGLADENDQAICQEIPPEDCCSVTTTVTAISNSTRFHSTRTLEEEDDLEAGILAGADGTCVVCLEPFSSGDAVVWSETPSCQHIFHKDCLVAYFAHHTLTTDEQQPQQQGCARAPNPCPVCRQPFVTIRREDRERSHRKQRTGHRRSSEAGR